MADNFRFAQLQTYSLAGGGAIAGATSITLKSMLDIDGNALSMSGTFGTIGFGTLEPGNGALEEQISFTGLTNNANGTVTLSGVSSVSFVYPYTATSGLAKTHAGSTTFVISNTSGFYDKLLSKNDDETIAGTYTFTNPNYPRMDTDTPFPTDNEQLATKAYADSLTFAGAPDATTTQKGLVEIATQAEVDAKTATGGTGASLVSTPALARSTLLSDYVADTGSANAYAIAPSPVITAYTTGQRFVFRVTNANTTTSTLAVNGLSATTIFKENGATALASGDLAAGQVVEVIKQINGFVLANPVANVPATQTYVIGAIAGTATVNIQSFDVSGTWTKPSGAVSILIEAWGGGGGSGGVANAQVSGGGGGGAFISRVIPASLAGATETVTVGAGGLAGVAGSNAGGAGGNSTFGSLLTAAGGGGADAGAASNSSGGAGGGVGSFSFAGGAGGTTGGGVRGDYGGGGGAGGGTGSGAQNGGPSMFGGGGGGNGTVINAAGTGGAASYGGGAGGDGATNGVGSAGTQPGGGGGGSGSNGAGNRTGAAGGAGRVRVTSYR